MNGSFFAGSELTVLKLDNSRVPKCGACGLYKTCNTPKMEPGGRGRSKVLIIGEHPMRKEDEKGVHFSGHDGKMLERVLAGLDVDLHSDCWSTNAIICRPPGDENKEPKSIEWCRPNLIQTVERLKPEVIIPLGTDAVHGLIQWLWKDKVDGVTRWAGYQIPDQKLNAWICPTFHPRHVQQVDSAVLTRLFVSHLKGARNLIGGRPWSGKVDFRKKVEVILSAEKAVKRLRSLPKKGIMAFDYETNMLKPDHMDSRIVCCSICFNGKDTFAFPWLGGVPDAMKKVLLNPDIGKLGFNEKFEQRWTLWHLGVRVRNWLWCGNNAAHALDNNHKMRNITSLKFQSYVITGTPEYDAHIKPYLYAKGAYDKNRIHEVDVRDLLMYCGMDSLLEYKVDKAQMMRAGMWRKP